MDMECDLSKIRMADVFLGRSKLIKIFLTPCRPHSAACKYMMLLNKVIGNTKAVINEQKESLPLSHFTSAKTSKLHN